MGRKPTHHVADDTASMLDALAITDTSDDDSPIGADARVFDLPPQFVWPLAGPFGAVLLTTMLWLSFA